MCGTPTRPSNESWRSSKPAMPRRRAVRDAKTRCASTRSAWFPLMGFVKITGAQRYLWRAIDQRGKVLEVLGRSRRNANAA